MRCTCRLIHRTRHESMSYLYYIQAKILFDTIHNVFVPRVLQGG